MCKEIVCRGSYGLGTACGHCSRCNSYLSGKIAELEAQVKGLEEENAKLSENSCDECLEYEDDGTPRTSYGWNENRVDGQVPCSCILESGPYQVLDQAAERYFDTLQVISTTRAFVPDKIRRLATEALTTNSKEDK